MATPVSELLGGATVGRQQRPLAPPRQEPAPANLSRQGPLGEALFPFPGGGGGGGGIEDIFGGGGFAAIAKAIIEAAKIFIEPFKAIRDSIKGVEETARGVYDYGREQGERIRQSVEGLELRDPSGKIVEQATSSIGQKVFSGVRYYLVIGGLILLGALLVIVGLFTIVL